MKTRARFALGFAIGGFAIGAAFGAYAGYVTSSHYSGAPPCEVLNPMIILCPPSIGSMALQNGGVAEDKSCCSPAVIVTFTGRSFKEFHRKYINNIKHLGEMSLIVAEMEYSRHLRAREFLTVA